MQRSFSIIDNEDDDEDDNIEIITTTTATSISNNSEKKSPRIAIEDSIRKIPSAGPSGRQTVLRSRPSQQLSSESEDDSLDNNDGDNKTKTTQKEYDAKQYENLDVSEEIKEIFQFITKYIPQTINLDYKFRPFIPEFIPAVGDIDAFLKVIPPEKLPSGRKFIDNQQLGLKVLDEPSTNQSDAAVLSLQLRANSMKIVDNKNIIIKKVDDVEKNAKIIEKWIKDISDLYKSKSSPMVRYQEVMPDLDDLMQQWPDDIENRLKNDGFPKPNGKTLEDYLEEICSLFRIPSKNRFHALHLLFSLYTAVENSQLLKNTKDNSTEPQNQVDQLVLE